MELDTPRLYLRSELAAEGYSDSELRRRRNSGALTLIRRGAYVDGRDARARRPESRHMLAVRAELPRIAASSVVSHVSAALLHGLPVWGMSLKRVHVTRARRTGARAGPSVHVHSAPLDETEIVDLRGTAVTSIARTVVDLARVAPFDAAVATADAALRAGLLLEDLDGAAHRAAGWPGCAAARRVVAFADGRAETVGESRSRVAIHRAGLPAPTPQWEVWRGRTLLGRCDFGWPELGAVGEFDGRIKYGRLLRPGQDPGEVVFEEKLREDAIRSHGLRVARWIWKDLDDFDVSAARIRSALAH